MMASEADYDINVTLAKLDCLKRSDVTELKALMKPPQDVITVLEALCTLLGRPGLEWKEIKHMMGNVDEFLRSLKNYDKDRISEKTIRQVQAYTSREGFTPENIASKSAAAASLC